MSVRVSGWVLVAVIGPPACFAFGKGSEFVPWGFLYVWGLIAVTAAALAIWDRPGADTRPRVRLRRPTSRRLVRIEPGA